ncbi:MULTISPECIES: hypothetical protein [Corallincola]|uniref:Uncharacterized protein n=3 Tax=Corallincola TaxID=1775176 RepID=A0A368N6J3_9GAMM|nr:MULTISPECIES: hypothetical protein [Corallincola]RCU45135.1 hypothetical protein DU002_17045 [Corallincola holothuriorum]TAA46819.1 hypothetical protein EXY25_06075 [Corallincola spongiicola]TCI04465.1 hypothetical protein EZV61_00365 [Corallincola luteus]
MGAVLEATIIGCLYFIPIFLTANLLQAGRRTVFPCIVAAGVCCSMTELVSLIALPEWSSAGAILGASALLFTLVLDAKWYLAAGIVAISYLVQMGMTETGTMLLNAV